MYFLFSMSRSLGLTSHSHIERWIIPCGPWRLLIISTRSWIEKLVFWWRGQTVLLWSKGRNTMSLRFWKIACNSFVMRIICSRSRSIILSCCLGSTPHWDHFTWTLVGSLVVSRSWTQISTSNSFLPIPKTKSGLFVLSGIMLRWVSPRTNITTLILLLWYMRSISIGLSTKAHIRTTRFSITVAVDERFCMRVSSRSWNIVFLNIFRLSFHTNKINNNYSLPITSRRRFLT